MITASRKYIIKSNWNIDFDCGIQHNSIDHAHTYTRRQTCMAWNNRDCWILGTQNSPLRMRMCECVRASMCLCRLVQMKWLPFRNSINIKHTVLYSLCSALVSSNWSTFVSMCIGACSFVQYIHWTSFSDSSPSWASESQENPRHYKPRYCMCDRRANGIKRKHICHIHAYCSYSAM